MVPDTREQATSAVRRDVGVLSAGILLGAGLGGFFDGIVLHQILQWHNMLSSVRPPVDLAAMKYNMVYDGLFHAGTWLMTSAGVARLWLAGTRSRTRWSTAAFIGALALGWGSFNFLEGLVDHQIVGLHHVHPGTDELAWDLGFLGSGLVLGVIGVTLVRASRKDATGRGRPATALTN